MHVKRFDLDEFAKFDRDYRRVGDPPSNRMLLTRKPEGDEQEKDEQEKFKISLNTVAERRLAEMDVVARAAYEKQDAEDEKFSKQFLVDAISTYVTVPAGEVEDNDEPVTTGAQLVRIFGARADVLRQLLQAIWTENTLSAAEKKVRRSLSGLSRSLNEQTLAVLGQTPVPTVEPAANAASVEIAGVTASGETIPSGSEAGASH